MLKKYDGLFIFAGAAKDEALAKLIEKVGAEIERLGGKVEVTDALGRRTFARPLKKRDSGVYVKVRFQLEREQVKALRARLRLSEDIFRAQILVRDERLDAAKAADQARRAAYRAAQAVAEAAAAPDPGAVAES